MSRSAAHPDPLGPILDYASPRARGKVRLPSQSRLEFDVDHGEVTVREALSGKGAALTAIVIAALTLVLMPATVLTQTRLRSAKDVQEALVFLVIVAAVWVSEVAVILLVIANTWRRTTLHARRDALLLTFKSPFGERRYEWPADWIEDVRLESTTRPGDRNHLAEVEVHIGGQPVVKLFTDHGAMDLEPLVSALRTALGLPSPERAA